MAVELQVRLLGGFEVRSDQASAAPSAWRLRKAKTLVKMLALQPGHALPRDVAERILRRHPDLLRRLFKSEWDEKTGNCTTIPTGCGNGSPFPSMACSGSILVMRRPRKSSRTSSSAA